MTPEKFIGVMEGPDDAKVWSMSGQVQTQLVAVAASALYAAFITALLVLILDKTIGFTVKPSDEATGLDLTQHGEVGLDVGQIEEEEAVGLEPKSASKPPVQFNGGSHRFTVMIDGVDPKEVHAVWSKLCEPGTKTPKPEFVELYKNLTTVTGNKFKFRGGNPVEIKRQLAALFEDGLDISVKTHVEH